MIFIDFWSQKKVKKIAFFSDERGIPQKIYSSKKVKKSDSSLVPQKSQNCYRYFYKFSRLVLLHLEKKYYKCTKFYIIA